MVLVHERCARNGCAFLVVAEVDMNLRAWAARTGVAHLPEVVLLVAEQDPVFRKMLLPCFQGLGVQLRAVCLGSLEYGCIKSVLVELVNICEKLPSPVDGLCLEVVAEAPVSEHFEHGVVICVAAYLLKVIVLSAYAKAFLAVGHPLPFRGTVAEEPVLELVHARVGEHECRVVLYDHRCRRHNLMPL